MPDTRVDVVHIAPPSEGGEIERPLPIEDPERASVVALGDPFTFPVPTWLGAFADVHAEVPVAGGLASGGVAPGQNVLFAGSDPINSGAVAVVLQGATRMVNAVSQGCRPVGDPLVATKVDGNVLLELRGQPAAKVLFEVLEELDEDDRKLFQSGAFLGRAVDASKSSFEPGDLLVRNIMGLDPQRHAIAVADDGFRAGTTFQLMVRDGASASAELDSVLEVAGLATAGQAAGGLLFTCGGRGQGMFGTPHRDAAAIERHFGPGFPVAGFSANGEIGSVGGRPFLHGFTASAALFAPRD
jgi:small ligand-binding sensory domain FIST